MIDYYPNGNKKQYRRKGLTSTKGEFTDWYESGKVKLELDENGKEEKFYENGQKESLRYSEERKKKGELLLEHVKITSISINNKMIQYIHIK